MHPVAGQPSTPCHGGCLSGHRRCLAGKGDPLADRGGDSSDAATAHCKPKGNAAQACATSKIASAEEAEKAAKPK